MFILPGFLEFNSMQEW